MIKLIFKISRVDSFSLKINKAFHCVEYSANNVLLVKLQSIFKNVFERFKKKEREEERKEQQQQQFSK